MPDFVFRGASPGLYPMLRDARGALAGTVTPGDVREFDAAPDPDWQPCEGSGDTGSAEAAQPEAAPDEPPAPDQPDDSPEPPAGEQDHDDTAGDGQEES